MTNYNSIMIYYNIILIANIIILLMTTIGIHQFTQTNNICLENLNSGSRSSLFKYKLTNPRLMWTKVFGLGWGLLLNRQDKK